MRTSVALLALVVLAAGCQMRTSVEVDVHGDGSGVVAVEATFDREAVEKLGGADGLRQALRVDDLKAGGWKVTGPTAAARAGGAGAMAIRAEKGFERPDDLEAVVEELAGPDGPFRDFHVERRNQLARSRWNFAGTVDFAGGVESFGDAGLAELLGGEPLGDDIASLSERMGGSIDDAFPVEVAVRLPGDVSSNAPEEGGGRAVWRPSLAQTTKAALVAEGRQWRVATLAFAAIGIAAVAALSVLVGLRLRPSGRHRRRPARRPFWRRPVAGAEGD